MTKRQATTAVQDLDPSTLLVDTNVRADARLDKEFVASVRDLGVLVPIVAVRTSNGQVRVRFGHRRTLAAIESDRPTVPVHVVGDEATDDAGTIERLVTQYAENEHRAGLTLTERVDVAAQLSLLGVSAAQITKRTKMGRKQVDAALIVAGSDTARATTARYDFLTLDQAAVVAEFEDDPETVKALVVAARDGRFDHIAQRARDKRADAQRHEAFVQALTKTRLRVVDAPGADPTGNSAALRSLVGADADPVTVESHTDCPGHAAYVKTEWDYIDPTTGQPTDDDQDDQDDDQDEGDDAARYDEDDRCTTCQAHISEAHEPDCAQDDQNDQDDDEGQGPARVWGPYLLAGYVCTDYAAHGHQRPAPTSYGSCDQRPKMADLTPKQQDKARAERRDVIESNKAWRSAETVRRDWLRTFLTRKTAPKGSAALIATAVALNADTLASTGGNTLAADLLGCQSTGYGRNHAVADLITKATEARAQVLTLAQVLAAYEDATHVGSWRNVNDGTRRYLEFIAANGYTLADVERRACGQDPLDIKDTA